MPVKKDVYNEDLDLFDSDIEFINEVLNDEDLIWDYPLYRVDDALMQWIIKERLERSESLDIFYDESLEQYITTGDDDGN